MSKINEMKKINEIQIYNLLETFSRRVRSAQQVAFTQLVDSLHHKNHKYCIVNRALGISSLTNASSCSKVWVNDKLSRYICDAHVKLSLLRLFPFFRSTLYPL